MHTVEIAEDIIYTDTMKQYLLPPHSPAGNSLSKVIIKLGHFQHKSRFSHPPPPPPPRQTHSLAGNSPSKVTTVFTMCMIIKVGHFLQKSRFSHPLTPLQKPHTQTHSPAGNSLSKVTTLLTTCMKISGPFPAQIQVFSPPHTHTNSLSCWQ
ncbi:unnamed protein product [Natator depressus]